MHPTLINIGPVPIHSYGFMLAISFLTAMFLSAKRAEKIGIDKNAIMDLAFWIILSAILGARLYYVLLHLEEFEGHWLDTINPFSNGQVGIGGLVMLGGMFGVIATTFIFLRIKKMPLLKTADVIAPTVGLGIFFTRIGCFLNGCCYGKCTTVPWGVTFPDASPAGYFQQSMHCNILQPSQLYLSVGGLIIFIILISTEKFVDFEGHNFIFFMALYSILRFAVDFTRHYASSESLWGLSHNQFFCVITLMVCMVAWPYLYQRSRKIKSRTNDYKKTE